MPLVYQKMLGLAVKRKWVTGDPVKFYVLQLEQYCRSHKSYISCLKYGTGLWIVHYSHCREYPQSCSDTRRALESVPPHHPAASSTWSYLKQSAYTMGIGSLLSTFLHNTFYVRDVHMARREPQHGTCECPPSILGNSAGKHFQYTYVFLEDSWLGINYISNSGKNLPLGQSYKFHSFHNDIASYLCRTSGIYCNNILQTMYYTLHKSAGHVESFHSLYTALPLL